MKKIIMTLIVLSMAIPMTLMAGDKEDIVKQIKQQWVDFSNKIVDMSTLHPNGTWQATSQGGLWALQSPKEVKSQIEGSPNTFNFRPHHIEVTIVGKNKDVAYTNYYLVGNITGLGGKVIAQNYRTRASGTLVKKGGKWVGVGQHFSPLYGGSGVIFD
ncbi:MAG TPA: hypothetical protein EYO50_08515 [Candidatus Marinimicrobia bacterium]|jgi:hypothetical protein|nr:hypothetical protein [Candidatus Neomarinimicrobiota bacterium]